MIERAVRPPERRGPGARAGLVLSVVGIFAVAGCSSPDGASEPVGVDRSASTGAEGYCRTRTCEPPEGYPTDDGLCFPDGWADSTTCAKRRASNAPIWWRSACVGYTVHEGASARVAFGRFSAAADAAFSAWTSVNCPSSGESGARVGIQAKPLGAVSCTDVGYDRTGPNQNLLIFRDDGWPHAEAGAGPSETIALTTVSFDVGSGEIYDADIELNSADHDIVDGDGGASGAFDLRGVLTHEVGHFFGLAHSPLESAVMFASGDPEAIARKRSPRKADIAGICAIYPADGSRAVSVLVSADGSIGASACDPSPRRGLDRCRGHD